MSCACCCSTVGAPLPAALPRAVLGVPVGLLQPVALALCVFYVLAAAVGISSNWTAYAVYAAGAAGGHGVLAGSLTVLAPALATDRAQGGVFFMGALTGLMSTLAGFSGSPGTDAPDALAEPQRSVARAVLVGSLLGALIWTAFGLLALGSGLGMLCLPPRGRAARPRPRPLSFVTPASAPAPEADDTHSWAGTPTWADAPLPRANPFVGSDE